MTEWGIDTLFNPGKRHMDEEKRRLQSTREEIGDASGGRRIDLESGTVRISRSGKAVRPDAPDAESTGTEPAGTKSADAKHDAAGVNVPSAGAPSDEATDEFSADDQRQAD